MEGTYQNARKLTGSWSSETRMKKTFSMTRRMPRAEASQNGGGVERGSRRRGRGLTRGSEVAALLLVSSSAETKKRAEKARGCKGEKGRWLRSFMESQRHFGDGHACTRCQRRGCRGAHARTSTSFSQEKKTMTDLTSRLHLSEAEAKWRSEMVSARVRLESKPSDAVESSRQGLCGWTRSKWTIRSALVAIGRSK